MRVLRGALTELERAALCALERETFPPPTSQVTKSMRDVDPYALPSARTWVGQRALGCYLIRYDRGGFAPPHVDVVSQGAHERLVLLVRASEVGGRLLVCGLPVALEPGDALEFRADLCEHEVTPVDVGSRLVLSLGRIGET